ncbi:MAG: alpha/beta hydrolase [Oscillospiraceae bacterium]|nr:alpha/beta hydrolase [Oscillospiraceae bacterium]
MSKTYEYVFNGYNAYVTVPENPNGKWIWKAEYRTAFNKAELALIEQGYTHVYYEVRFQYGCPKVQRLMHNFHLDVIERFNLQKKCILIGMSVGGLYSFNYTLAYPEYVEKVYLDAPALDVYDVYSRFTGEDVQYYDKMLGCYGLTRETVKDFKDFPIYNLKEFFDHNIPVLLVAGDADPVCRPEKNYQVMLRYCEENNIPITVHIKPGCGHHPHGLEDITPILNFVNA